MIREKSDYLPRTHLRDQIIDRALEQLKVHAAVKNIKEKI